VLDRQLTFCSPAAYSLRSNPVLVAR
jgi:hypothetical protein